MRDYEELTRLGKIRRFRVLAETALENYDIEVERFAFVRQAGNTLFRVYAADSRAAGEADGPYEPGQFLLRIYQPGWQTPEAIDLELEWLASMRRDAGLPVPEPVPDRGRRLRGRVEAPGIPGERDYSLLKWIKGSLLTKGIGPPHYRAQGRLMARMHEHAARWDAPSCPTKRRYDADGLFRTDAGGGLTEEDTWPHLPGRLVRPFEAVAAETARVMDEWGEGSDVFGLIHAEVGADANLLFWKGEARPIDFDGSGFGYWVYDLAAALEHVRDTGSYSAFRDALLDGYAEVRLLPDTQLARLELFIAAFYVYYALWCAAMRERHPSHREGLTASIDRAGRLVERFLGDS
jgi:Ser/Thr protein kinase RdoA (MazF antagonist)